MHSRLILEQEVGRIWNGTIFIYPKKMLNRKYLPTNLGTKSWEISKPSLHQQPNGWVTPNLTTWFVVHHFDDETRHCKTWQPSTKHVAVAPVSWNRVVSAKDGHRDKFKLGLLITDSASKRVYDDCLERSMSDILEFLSSSFSRKIHKIAGSLPPPISQSLAKQFNLADFPQKNCPKKPMGIFTRLFGEWSRHRVCYPAYKMWILLRLDEKPFLPTSAFGRSFSSERLKGCNNPGGDYYWAGVQPKVYWGDNLATEIMIKILELLKSKGQQVEQWHSPKLTARP